MRRIVHKSEFSRYFNNVKLQEPLVTCVGCERAYHAACVLHMERKDCPYVCRGCRPVGTPAQPLLEATNMPRCDLSDHIEAALARLPSATPNRVTVRLLAENEFSYPLRTLLAAQHPHNREAAIPYRMKVITAFQNIDTKGDVLFFVMYVQEYLADCPEPNRGRVYISYLDSINLFQPSNLRTDVYHTIIISYLNSARRRGFNTAHIWACPPNSGDDYVFYRHPADQKTPRKSRLIGWYQSLLVQAVRIGAVASFSSLYEWMVAERVVAPAQVPLFEGDFWPPALEDMLAASGSGLWDVARRFGEEFMVVRLQQPQLSLVAEVPHKTEQESRCVLRCTDVVARRDNFLVFCQEELLEWSSLRRARLGTQRLLEELRRDNEGESYSCDQCGRTELPERWACPRCLEFDLCLACREKGYHSEHEMQLLQSHLMGAAAADGNGKKKVTKAGLLERLRHALRCVRPCPSAACATIKGMFVHAGDCELAEDTCRVCIGYSALMVAHVHDCTASPGLCLLPFCNEVRQRERRREARVAWERAFQEQLRYQEARDRVAREQAAALSKLQQALTLIRSREADSIQRNLLLQRFITANPDCLDAYHSLLGNVQERQRQAVPRVVDLGASCYSSQPLPPQPTPPPAPSPPLPTHTAMRRAGNQVPAAPLHRQEEPSYWRHQQPQQTVPIQYLSHQATPVVSLLPQSTPIRPRKKIHITNITNRSSS